MMLLDKLNEVPKVTVSLFSMQCGEIQGIHSFCKYEIYLNQIDCHFRVLKQRANVFPLQRTKKNEWKVYLP